MSKKRKNPTLAAWGRLGRAANTEAQKEAARINGAKGGRPPGHRCPSCGATGRDVPTVKFNRGWAGGQETRYSCQKCGQSGLLRDIKIKVARPRRRHV